MSIYISVYPPTYLVTASFRIDSFESSFSSSSSSSSSFSPVPTLSSCFFLFFKFYFAARFTSPPLRLSFLLFSSPSPPSYPVFVDSGSSASSLCPPPIVERDRLSTRLLLSYIYILYINAKYTSFLQICSNRVDERRFKAHIKFVRTSYSRLLAVCP